MARRPPIPIDVIEAAYDLEPDDQAWLHQVTVAVRPLIDGGRGVYSYFYDLATHPVRWLDNPVVIDMDVAELEHSRRLVTSDPQDTITEAHAVPEPFESALQALRKAGLGDVRQHPPYAEFLANLKAADFLGFRTIEAGGKGIGFAATHDTEQHVDRRTQRLWARVAAHVAAARRLREALQSAPVEAVLTPNGKLEHAEGSATLASARDALRAAVLRSEKARGRMRRTDPTTATEMWTALVSGRWSTIDQFERGGRRYIVARANPHTLASPRALARGERAVVQLAALGKSIKLIAYELGLAPSTVSTHLAVGMRKLGVKSRTELVRMGAQLFGS